MKHHLLAVQTPLVVTIFIPILWYWIYEEELFGEGLEPYLGKLTGYY